MKMKIESTDVVNEGEYEEMMEDYLNEKDRAILWKAHMSK